MRAVAVALALFFVALPAAAQDEPPPPDAPPPVEEPAKAKPSIVIDAKDYAGGEVRSVTVFVDDQVAGYELTGKPIELEPGAHTVAIQRNDGPRQRLTASFTLADSDANHAVHFAFEKPAEDAPLLDKPLNAPVVPRVMAGVGIAGVITGVVLLLARPTLPANCNTDTGKCTRLSAQTAAQFADDRETAGTNHGLFQAGLITLISGAALTVGGVVWYVLERKPFEATKPRAMFAPWLRSGSGGMSFRAVF